jgi:hypothetical protein
MIYTCATSAEDEHVLLARRTAVQSALRPVTVLWLCGHFSGHGNYTRAMPLQGHL